MNMVQNKVEQQGCYRLWSDCFGDSAQYMDYYFTEKTKDNQIYQIEKEGEVISMLHLNPFDFLVNGTKHRLHYIVGVATKEEERGKGLMRQVLTETLRLQQRKGELFTYLMPAAKEIYLPYDFRYMYTQKRVMGTLPTRLQGVAGAVRFETLTEAEKQQIVSYVNEKLEEDFDCAVVRDVAYYDRLCKEMQAAGGDVIVMQEENKLLGITAFMLENGHLEVVETVTDREVTSVILNQLQGFISEQYEDEQLEAAWLETHFLDKEVLKSKLTDVKEKEQPIIMARLLSVKEALEVLKLEEGASEFTVTIKVDDPIIEENNKAFCITATSAKIMVELEENPLPSADIAEANAQLSVSIADLTEWFFGVRKIPELAGIETLARPYINDIV